MIYGLCLAISFAAILFNTLPAVTTLLNTNDDIAREGSGLFVLSSSISILLIFNKIQIIGLDYLYHNEVRYDSKEGILDKFINFIPIEPLKKRDNFEFAILSILDLAQIYLFRFS